MILNGVNKCVFPNTKEQFVLFSISQLLMSQSQPEYGYVEKPIHHITNVTLLSFCGLFLGTTPVYISGTRMLDFLISHSDRTHTTFIFSLLFLYTTKNHLKHCTYSKRFKCSTLLQNNIQIITLFLGDIQWRSVPNIYV